MSRASSLSSLALLLCLVAPAWSAEAPLDPAVAEARTAMRRGEHRAALILLNNRLQQAPDDTAARRLLVQVRLDLGQPAEARAEIERLAATGGQSGGQSSDRQTGAAGGLPPNLQADLGRALLMQGRFGDLEAVIDPGTASRQPQLRAELTAQLGQANLGLGQPEVARTRFAEARTLDPANPRALLGLARLAYAHKDAGDAADLVRQALDADPAAAEGWEFKGDLAAAQGDPKAAAAAYSQAIEHSGNPWLSHYKRALTLIDRDDLPGAAADIAAVRAGNPDFPGLDLAEGALALRRGDASAAWTHLETYLGGAPTDLTAAGLAGLALTRLKRPAEATAILTRAGIDRSDDPRVAMLQARILLEQGQAAAAEQRVLPVSGAAGPGQADDLLYRALIAQDRRADAVPVLRRLVERAPAQPAYSLPLAEALVGSGDRAGARAELERLLRAVPGNLEASVALAQLDLADGAGDRALATARELAAAHPADARVQLLLGFALSAARDTAGARTALTRALALKPGFEPAALALANLELRDRDPAAARTSLQGLLGADAANTAALVGLATLDAGEQNPGGGAERLRQGLAAAPANLKLRLALAGLLARGKDLDGALAVLAQAPAEQAADPALLQARGLLELARGRNDAALAAFEQLAKTSPDAAGAHYLLALARSAGARGPATALEADLTRALGLDPRHPLAERALGAAFAAQTSDETRVLLAVRLAAAAPGQPAIAFEQGRLALARGDSAAAVESLRIAAEARPDHQGYRYALLKALKSAGDSGGAIDSGRVWLTAHPDDLATRDLVAGLLVGQGRTGEAADQYRAILERAPKNPIALNNLAMLLLPTDPKAALAFAEQAEALAPGRPEIADTLGAALLAAGQPARALPVLKKAMAAGGANPSIAYHYAAALAATGDQAQALTLLTGLQGQTFPERDAARALLAGLQAKR